MNRLICLLALALACSHNAPAAAPQPAETPAPVAAPPAPAAAASAPPSANLQAAGTSHTDVEGCLAASTDAAGGSRFPVTRGTRTSITASAVPTGLVVTHALSHACCLAAEVHTEPGAGTVHVLEKLTGSPCRCMCASTLRTSVGLAPGPYQVQVDLEEGGAVRRVFEGPVVVEVPALHRESP